MITSIELSRFKMIACVAAPMWPRSGDTPVGSSAWLDTAPGLFACEWSVHALDTPPAHARTHSLTLCLLSLQEVLLESSQRALALCSILRRAAQMLAHLGQHRADLVHREAPCVHVAATTHAMLPLSVSLLLSLPSLGNTSLQLVFRVAQAARHHHQWLGGGL